MSDSDFSVQRQIDVICDEFDNQWTVDERSDIKSFLNQIALEHRDQLLSMLLEIDVESRQKAGHEVSADDYSELGEGAVVHVIGLLAVDADATIPPPDSSDSHLTTHPAETPAPSTSSNQIGPYKLLRKIGEGGMGTVWMAEQREPVKRRVALKLIRSDLGTKETIARFEAERQALAMMDHQNIARVLDAGTTESGSPYFVMELVKGVPLNEYCDNNKLSVPARLELMVDVCNAIQHAHQKGIIHRDLKPSNVLVTESDGMAIPKVIDFGLAKALEHTHKLTDKTLFTEFGQVVGTLQYMSPEQAEMDSLDIDTRTDIYSLGVMLYELLTGSTPIDKETLVRNALLQVLELIREKEPQRPSDRLSSTKNKARSISNNRKIAPSKLEKILRGELDWIIMKALEKDRERRYDTANKLADDIGRYLGGESVDARPPTIGYRLNKFVKKNRGFVTASALIVAALLFGIGMSTWFAFKADGARAEAVEARHDAEKVTDRSKYFLSLARWEAGRVSEADELLEEMQPKHRNFEWHLAKKEFKGSYLTLNCDSAVTQLSLSADGSLLASVCEDKHSGDELSTNKLWNLKRGTEKVVTFNGFDSSSEYLALSPTGDSLISADSALDIVDGVFDYHLDFRTMDSRTGILVESFCKETKRSIESVDISPDGRLVAICHVSSGGLRVNGVELSTSPLALEILDSKSGEQIREIIIGTENDRIDQCQFTSDSSKLLLLHESKIGLIEIESGIEIWSREIRGFLKAIAIHPNGRWAVVQSSNKIGFFNIDDGEIIREIAFPDRAGPLEFTPDGSRLVTASGNNVKIWSLPEGKLIREFRGHRDEVTAICVTPDGLRIVSGSKDETIKVWEIDPPTAIGPGDFVAGIDFSGDRNTDVVSVFTMEKFGRWNLATRRREPDAEVELAPVDSEESGRRVPSHNNGRVASSRSANGNVYACQFTLNDKHVIGVWDLKTGDCLRNVFGEVHRGSSIGLSPNGRILVAAISDEDGFGSKKTLVWNTVNESEAFTIKSIDVTSVCFSPDGEVIVLGKSDGTIDFVDGSTGEHHSTIEYPDTRDSISCVKHDVRGEVLFAATRTGEIWAIEPGSGKRLLKVQGHSGRVNSLAVSPDGSRLASSGESEFKLWDTESGQELRASPRRGNISDLEFNADGSVLAINCYGQVEILDTRPITEQAVEQKAETNALSHRRLASKAESDKDWYTAVFHRAWQFKGGLEATAAFDRLHFAYFKLQNIDSSQAQSGIVMQPTVREMLRLPSPPRTRCKNCAPINSNIWEKVKVNPSEAGATQITADELIQIQSVVKKHARGIYFNTLAVAEYRMDHFEAAIEAALTSVTLTPKQEANRSAPFPVDFAILAMSNFKLGDMEDANHFRKQLEEAMKRAVSEDDEDCNSFVDEVNTLFASQEADNSSDDN